MKKTTALILALIMIIPCRSSFAQERSIKPGDINSRNVVVMDLESGRVLFEKNSGAVVPMASTTKIMTAIVALENSKLSDIVTISERAGSIQGSTVGLSKGQKFTMEQLLYGLLLQSGNDCAIAIAEHVGGSVENFAELMNSKALEIGAFNTHFITPHGLDRDGHFTTPYELALITRYAFKNETFQKIVGTRSIDIPWRNGTRRLYNTNRLLGSLTGADGVKTGYTGKAGRCLVSSATRNGRTVICVLLNSYNRWNDSTKLIDYSFNNYRESITCRAGDYTGNVRVIGGTREKVIASIEQNCNIPISSEEITHLSIKQVLPESVDAPVYKGQQIGSLEFSSGDKTIYSIPLRAVEDVGKSHTKGFLKIY